MAKKFDLTALIESLPEVAKLFDDKWDALAQSVGSSSRDAAKLAAAKAEALAKEASVAAAKAKQLAKKQAKNPIAQTLAVGFAVALVAGVAYALFKPTEEELWQQVEVDEADAADAVDAADAEVVQDEDAN